MSVGVLLGVLGLMLLASSANSQQMVGFAEADYEVIEDSPSDRTLLITKSGANVGTIIMTLRFLTLEEFRNGGFMEDPFDTAGVDPAEFSSASGLPDDYNATTVTLSFPPSNDFMPMDYTAPIIADDIHEETEGFFVQILFSFEDTADSNNFDIIREGFAFITIANDDSIMFGFQMEIFTLEEDSGDTGVVFGKVNNDMTELTLDVIIDFDLRSAGLLEGSDFTLNATLPMIFSFEPDDQFKSLTVSVIDDNLLEVTESFALSLFQSTSIPDVTFNPSIAEVQLLDNEVIVMGFSDTEITVSEDVGTVQVGLQVFNPPSVSAEFANTVGISGFGSNIFAVAGSALAPDDFSATDQVVGLTYNLVAVTFVITPPTFSVIITDDNVPEEVEELTLSLIQFIPDIVVRAPNVSRLIIQDNDATPSTIGLEQDSYGVTEGDGFVEVCVAILTPANLSLLREPYQANLSLSLQSVTAQVGEDFEDLLVDFSLSTANPRQCFNVTIIDDDILEVSEYFRVSLVEVGALPQNASLSLTMARVNITDNDEGIVGLNTENVTVTEGTDDFAVVRVSFLSPAVISDATFTELRIFTIDGSAMALSDYNGTFMTITLRGGGEEVLEIMIPIIDDNIVEQTESFTLQFIVNGDSGNIQLYQPSMATIQVIDDDMLVPAFISLEQSIYVTSEGDVTVEICAVLTVENGSTLMDLDPAFVANLNFMTVEVPDSATEGEDYTDIAMAFSLTPNAERECFDVPIIDDPVLELTEYFNASLDSNGPLPPAASLTITEARIRINDNDVGTIGFRNTSYIVREPDGPIIVYVEFLSPDEISSDIVVDVTLSTENDTAFGTSDFVEDVVDFTLQGGVAEVFMYLQQIIDNTLIETPDSEDFFLRITASHLLIDENRLTIAPDSAVVTIIDDDVASLVGFEQPEYNVNEDDGFVEICAAIMEPSNVLLLPDSYLANFSLSLVNGTAVVDEDFDDIFVFFSLTPTMPRQCVNVSIIDDTILEISEDFNATLVIQDPQPPNINFGDLETRVIISDDDVAVVGFDINNVTVFEADGLATLLVEFLSPAQVSPDVQVLLTLSTADNTALAGSDYIQTTISFTLSGGGDEVFLVEFDIINDNIPERPDTENFIASLTLVSSNVPVTLDPQMAFINIVDDDVESVIGFEDSMYVVGEGDGFVEVCVAILEPQDLTTLNSTYAASVDITTLQNGTAIAPFDYLSGSGSFVLTPSNSRACLNVTIVDDNVLELDEDFSATLTGTLPPGAAFDPTSTNVLINDNEVGQIAILNESITVLEDAGSVTVYVGFISPDEISEDIFASITFSTADDTAIAGADYSETQVTFTLQGGGIMEIYPVVIPILSDFEIELDEIFNTFIVFANAPPPGIILDPDSGMVIIEDVSPDLTATVFSPPPTMTPTPSVTPGGGGEGGVGGDPHYSIMLPSGQPLCFSVHGEKDFPFNLISNNLLQMNAFFIEDALREEITWIGSLGVVVQHAHYKKSNTTKIRFEAKDQMIYINNGVSLHANRIEKLTLSNGKLTVSEALRKKGDKKPEVEVDLVDAGLTFSVRFAKKRHLDMAWKKVELQPADSHGLIGQFMRKGVEIDETRKLLYLPSLEPVPVMRSSVWHFMERESPDLEQKLCWQAMNPGYQGKRLIEGNYLDYLVDDVLSSDFQFKPTSNE